MFRDRTAVIVDIDNTLFDWLRMWHAAFSAMLESLVERSGIPRVDLLRDFRAVHQRRGTVEYSFAIEELPSLRRAFPNEDLSERFHEAIQRYRDERRKHLVLYPGVSSTLRQLKQQGIAIAAYTESQAFYARRRVQWLELDGLIDLLYSTPDHDIPSWVDLRTVRRYSDEHYELRATRHIIIEEGKHKPQPDVLKDILSDLRVSEHHSLHVGDSLHHDILMAQSAGVADVWAQYGVIPNRPEYDLLASVTHWTDEMVATDRTLRAIEVKPSFVLKNAFSEVLELTPLLTGVGTEPRLRRKLG